MYRINELREPTVLYILPNMDKSKEEFYNVAHKKIKPKYQWYFDGLRGISNDCKFICTAADSLIIKLDDNPM